jgi:hypothetical protein
MKTLQFEIQIIPGHNELCRYTLYYRKCNKKQTNGSKFIVSDF